MFNIEMLGVDHTCVDGSMSKGVSYEPCARRASSRALVRFVRDMFPAKPHTHGKDLPSHQFSEAFLNKLIGYFQDATHAGVSTPLTTRRELFKLMSDNPDRHQNFVRILRAGIQRAQDVTSVPGSVADDSRPTRTPLELQFQAMANAVIIEVLETLLVGFDVHRQSLRAKNKSSIRESTKA